MKRYFYSVSIILFIIFSTTFFVHEASAQFLRMEGVVSYISPRWLVITDDTGQSYSMRIGWRTRYYGGVPVIGARVLVDYLWTRGVMVAYYVNLLPPTPITPPPPPPLGNAPQAPTVVAPQYSYHGTAKIGVPETSLRYGPSFSYPTIKTVKEGVKVELLGYTGLWYYVKLPGGDYGWIYSRELSPATPTNNFKKKE